MGSQHSAQADCDRGVLRFTKTNFMRCLLTYQSELMTVPGRRINRLKRAQKSSTQLRQLPPLARAPLAPLLSRSLALSCEGGRSRGGGTGRGGPGSGEGNYRARNCSGAQYSIALYSSASE